MSEYWKSTPKYWCKHCSIYVKDTPFERKQHENTGKHQGSLKRFLRGIQNDHERNEREKQKAKQEVERLNRVVGGGTTAAGPANPGSSHTSSLRKATSVGQSVADQKRQWAQLAEMGIQVPDSFRSENAMAGDWQTVSQVSIDEPAVDEKLNVGVRKRKYENQEDEEEEEEKAAAEAQEAVGTAVKRRGWGSTTRNYPGDVQEDLDALLGKSTLRRKQNLAADTPSETDQSMEARNNVSANSPTTSPGIAAQETGTHTNASETEDKVESDRSFVKDEAAETSEQALIAVVPDDVPVPVFKKRKPKIRS